MGLWWLGLTVVLASMPDMASMQRDLDQLGHIADPFSYRVTNSNYQEVKNGTTWLLNFCHPKAMHCKLLNVPWKSLAQEALEQEGVVVARVEPEDGLEVFRKFGVADVPTVLVVAEGYVYNYTGKLEPRQLREILPNATYLMYDRRKLSPALTDLRYWARLYSWTLAKAYAEHPSCFHGSAAVLLAAALLLWGLRKLRSGSKSKTE